MINLTHSHALLQQQNPDCLFIPAKRFCCWVWRRWGSSSLGEQVATHFYQVVQEAAINALKHAGAEQIDTILEGRGESLKLLVSHDGTGVEPGRQLRVGGICRRKALPENCPVLVVSVLEDTGAGSGVEGYATAFNSNVLYTMEEVELNEMFSDRDLLEELLGRIVRLEASMSVLLGEVANHRLTQEGKEQAEDMQSRIHGQIEKMEAAIYQELVNEYGD